MTLEPVSGVAADVDDDYDAVAAAAADGAYADDAAAAAALVTDVGHDSVSPIDDTTPKTVDRAGSVLTAPSAREVGTLFGKLSDRHRGNRYIHCSHGKDRAVAAVAGGRNY